MTWRDDVYEWGRTTDASDALPISRVESRVRLAAGDIERDIWFLNILEGAAWLAAIVAPVTFMAYQPEFGRPVPIENATAYTIAGVCFAIAMLGPPLALIRWLRRGRRRSVLTVWSYGFIAICVGVGVVFMFIRSGFAGDDPGFWPLVGIATVLLCLVGLGLQFFGTVPRTSEIDEQRESDMRDVRNGVLGILRDRGIIGDALYERAVSAPFRELFELNSVPAHEQER